MGNILKKPIGINPKIQQNCESCNFPVISPSSKFTNDNNCPHTICKDCISNHIKSNLEINAIEITCPGPDCKAVLDPVVCRDIVDDLPYQKWLDRLCYAAIVGREKCYCPHGNCRALIVDECCVDGGSVTTKSQCPVCKGWLCFLCRTAWHEGRECDLNRGREIISLNDMMFMGMTVGFYKKFCCCPNCRSFTELVSQTGFCIVRCRCKTVYCYYCEREIRGAGCDGKCIGCHYAFQSYHKSLMCKWSFIMISISIPLLIWINFIADPDVYF